MRALPGPPRSPDRTSAYGSVPRWVAGGDWPWGTALRPCQAPCGAADRCLAASRRVAAVASSALAGGARCARPYTLFRGCEWASTTRASEAACGPRPGGHHRDMATCSEWIDSSSGSSVAKVVRVRHKARVRRDGTAGVNTRSAARAGVRRRRRPASVQSIAVECPERRVGDAVTQVPPNAM